ncbi:cation diffusion facilitator family transporter [Bradyrhizobium sp. WBOS7]|uniref:Cation diffusion facilitator family transporter n=1 Tax=Bradyrhizobium betae TaxID=244734 RepID=A0AAE9NE14_9BRAD|nr:MULTISPECIES: cation-efflux pump [Bradyrhizobium]MDD1571940.1 cation diffusion facilitator family transporter [Bradyrhizobium sp. WBOS1]UUO36137.1 cation diffusion facilitator family transporter [Bradyrhizobium sp. WBOS01]MDD1526804.1 cation diffusion facilitator family transporter [Bradyrhizobium sp. WBOS2]MDD1575444.1 cation diffusion facilitator family transporter [Bradyrhizobium sp. WBOS7]MDD1600907.1 cation diffusion facilitator family transporter [Bradyrhizobium sp. WBOS16]
MTSQHDKTSVAAISIFASGGMAAAKFAVGIAIGSLALISEALHSSIDLVATIITWAVVRVSDKPADEEHHYGHGKLESISALGVTALLYVLAGGILVEAYSRLSEGTPPPTISAVPFVVLVIDIIVNLWRARALHRAARETRSQALAADALHFASDVMGSFAVIVGLILAGLGFWWGDAAAAAAVAVMIAALGLRMAGSTVQTLVDRAPEGAQEKATAAIRSVPGVIDVERLRVRMVGATTFIDTIAKVPRTYPIDRVEEIKRKAHAAVDQAFGDADLSFTPVPVARDNETVRDRIMVIARNSGLAVHHVTVHDLGTIKDSAKLIVSIDLEVDGGMHLEAAHEIANTLERNIQEEFGEDVEVDVHIEPLEPELPFGVDATPERVRTIAAALAEFAGGGEIHDIHNVRVRNTDAGEIVNFHCRATPSMSVTKVHEHVDAIERALRRAFPSVKRVISHAEPPRA